MDPRKIKEIALVAARPGKCQQPLKTRVIMILNFSRPHAIINTNLRITCLNFSRPSFFSLQFPFLLNRNFFYILYDLFLLVCILSCFKPCLLNVPVCINVLLQQFIFFSSAVFLKIIILVLLHSSNHSTSNLWTTERSVGLATILCAKCLFI